MSCAQNPLKSDSGAASDSKAVYGALTLLLELTMKSELRRDGADVEEMSAASEQRYETKIHEIF